ncbi:hypothetical protein FVEG_16847 [Fusarium verticillioides 7600]|uniref:Uncharacterized protein n=1 Tax=Gibberella moniliformis (strain M3125 / FGSC 7600) TaxID=334819 RepID=W7MK38_GIBM7|nr:hypothetical protein FVEG_16847 [Fusarium verticillioides 7600]EWG51753.1 hypothetical protein FVEG_16847 [Fusarium verticillioides 7600]
MSATKTSTINAHGSHVRLQLDTPLENTLQDYKIHHSSRQSSLAIDQQSGDRNIVIVAGISREAQPSEFDSSLAPHPTVPYPVSNPGWWTDTFRRVPDYRPINQHLDLNERRQMLLFTIVGGIMVRGCWLMSVWAQVWRNTAGRVTDIGLSKVGGEW